MLDNNATAKPFAVAGAFSSTVISTESPVLTEAASTPILLKAIGTTDKIAVFFTPFTVAEIVTDCDPVTANVPTGNVTEL